MTFEEIDKVHFLKSKQKKAINYNMTFILIWELLYGDLCFDKIGI